MANDHKVSLQECTRLILLLIAFGSGIAMIAMISNSEKYGCVVLSEVKWSRCGEKNDVYCFDIAKKPSSCSYLINSQGTACFVSCLIMLFFLIQLIVKKEYNPKCSQMFTAVVSLIFTLLALVGACILTDTIRKLCKGLVESDIGLLGGPCEDYHFKNKDGDDKLYFIRPLKEAKISPHEP
ncbi:uncharacterized protein LOC117109877 [Anneissia japonica]|uniref:uncharacterized protein LOC117109877 n=1 Tax=Anneissia japonica TaxID=1529436 RepID=UPI00142593B0|nr:uncharacterized protein LOC117109877 [Anneissia japonica]